MNCSRCGIYTCPSERTDTPQGMLCKACAARAPQGAMEPGKAPPGAAVPHVMEFEKLLSAKSASWNLGKDLGKGEDGGEEELGVGAKVPPTVPTDSSSAAEPMDGGP